MGVIKNGVLKGTSLIDYINTDKIKILGAHASGDFPLLVKLIDADDFLSVQVHPGDGYARRAGDGPCGKNEIWYILESPPGGYLVIGLKDGVKRAALEHALATGSGAEELLNKLYVQQGDVIDIPAGLIHAVGKGIILAEIQQNSDLTYRVYDYNRTGLNGKPRELHIKKALDVIDFDNKIPRCKVMANPVAIDGCTVTRYISNPYFCVDKYDIPVSYNDKTDPGAFHIYTCVGGAATIATNGFTINAVCGDSVFMPAAFGAYTVYGPCALLKCSVPYD